LSEQFLLIHTLDETIIKQGLSQLKGAEGMLYV